MLPYILALLPLLHRDASHTGDVYALTHAIDYTVNHDDLPIGWTREYTAAVLLVTAWEESRFRMDKRGDSGKAYCAFQIHGSPSLASNPLSCTRTALSYIRKSVIACPLSPLAPYTGGCTVAAAQRKSAERLWKVETIMEGAKVP